MTCAARWRSSVSEPGNNGQGRRVYKESALGKKDENVGYYYRRLRCQIILQKAAVPCAAA